MKLAELCRGIGRLMTGEVGDLKITHITHDSRKVQHGSIFVAIEGARRDGHDYIGAATQLGAVCIMTTKPEKVPCSIPIVQVEDPRKAMAQSARKLYGFPDRSLRVIGVTGTNGKTTFTYLVNHLLRPLGKAGRIGTLSYFNGVSEEKSSRTTPESTELFQALGEMLANGCIYAALEVSSHGLMLHRVLGLELRYAVFTNLSPDHLDFHGDMESYFLAKHRQFRLLVKDGVAIVNWDDPYGRRIQVPTHARLLRYGQAENADLRFEVVSLNSTSSIFDVYFRGEKQRFEIPLIGKHNIYNFVAALGVALSENRSMREAAHDARGVRAVPGRMELLNCGQDFGVIVDFAHTPDALEKVLEACAQTTKNRLIVVFGAGGDRDREKRPLMGSVVDRHADIILLTSDNPRDEDPEAIMEMVQTGIKRPLGVAFFRNWDRHAAITDAINMATPGDLVLIAGKGHETTQEVCGVHHPFNDRTVATELIKKRVKGADHV